MQNFDHLGGLLRVVEKCRPRGFQGVAAQRALTADADGDVFETLV